MAAAARRSSAARWLLRLAPAASSALSAASRPTAGVAPLSRPIAALSGGNNPTSWKLRRFFSSNEKHLPAISDPEIESAFKDLLVASWNELPDSLVEEAKKAASKPTDDNAGQEALKNVFRAAEACEEFIGTLVTLRMALDDLCGLTGENVGPLPGYIEDAVKAAYNRYMTYLESFGPEENYLRKKVETELGTKMIHLKMRCSGIGSEWGKIARRLLGKILIDLRNTREEAISVAEPKFIEDEALFLPTNEAEHQQKIQVRNEDGRRSSSTSEKSLDQEDEDDRETKYRLDPKYANVRTPERHVRTRLYFTSESHIHSLMNVLRYCNLDESLQGEESLVCQSALDRLHRTRELDYMSNIVLRMFENTEVPLEDEKRFRIEMTFSRGADLSPLEDKTSESSLLQEHTLPIMGPERLQEVGSCLTMDKFEKMVRSFAMPPEDFPPAAPPQALGYFSKGAGGMLERLVSLWPFHKSANAANGK